MTAAATHPVPRIQAGRGAAGGGAVLATGAGGAATTGAVSDPKASRPSTGVGAGVVACGVRSNAGQNRAILRIATGRVLPLCFARECSRSFGAASGCPVFG